jgi:hypothetical protein
MIISASYKTDIPAFYAKWFRNRLKAGYCKMVNPYNKEQHFRISLRPEDVDGFIFWTKNVRPFQGALEDVSSLNIPFVIQHTINGYPRELESRVIQPEKACESFIQVSEKYGPDSMVWRYDTIVFSDLTTSQWHVENFDRLAKRLEGSCDEVVVSFMQVYAKTRTNMNQMTYNHGVKWHDPSDDEKSSLADRLAEIADSYGMSLNMCSQPQYTKNKIGKARCIDAERLQKVSGREFSSKKGGNRTGCGCFKSKDIGDYDTCPHGCIYCYAVKNRQLALSRFKQHDSDGEYLFTPEIPDPKGNQLSLI